MRGFVAILIWLESYDDFNPGKKVLPMYRCKSLAVRLSPGFNLCGRPRKTCDSTQLNDPTPIVIVEVQVKQGFNMIEGGYADDNKHKEQEDSGQY